MRSTDFLYKLPKARIAKKLHIPRDQCRMMVVNRKKGTIEHKWFRDIASYVKKGDVLVTNNTKVFPAKLMGKKEKNSAKIEMFLLRELDKESNIWDALVEPARKVRVGNKIYFENNLVAEVSDNTTSRGRTVKFINPEDNVLDIVNRIGRIPLPPGLTNISTQKDTFQTVFAEVPGAVAVPSAGLHFTKPLVKRLEKKGIYIIPITLHSGFTTYKTIDVGDITKYKLDSEYCLVTPRTAQIVNYTKENRKGKVFSVGTTVCRVLEEYSTIHGKIKNGESWISNFIHPPYNFKVTDHLITNFHAPLSMMLILACAFGGYELIMSAYKEAIKKKYQFLSYGDAMLIL